MGAGASSKAENCGIREKYSWEQSDDIGSGSFAVVYRAKLLEEGRVGNDGTPIPNTVAIKVIDKSNLSSEDIPHLKEECEIMNQINHPNCVKLYEYFEDQKTLYLVLELVAGGELFDSIIEKGFFNEVEAAHAVRQMALALMHLEEKKIVHRDVKPENLIYASNEPDAVIKLTDYGLAKSIAGANSDTPLTDACGTPGYVAPELLQGQPYGCSVDVWAMGVILYIVLCGYPPFHDPEMNQSNLFKQIKRGNFSFHSPYWDNVSDSAKSLVTKILTVDPIERPTAAEILKEPWVADPEAQSRQDLGIHVIEGIKNVKNQRFRAAVNKLRALSALNSNIFKQLQDKNKEDIAKENTSPLEVHAEHEEANLVIEEKFEKSDEKEPKNPDASNDTEISLPQPSKVENDVQVAKESTTTNTEESVEQAADTKIDEKIPDQDVEIDTEVDEESNKTMNNCESQSMVKVQLS